MDQDPNEVGIDLTAVSKVLAGRKTLRQRKAEAISEAVDLDSILQVNPLLSDLELTGFEDDLTRRLLVASHLMNKSGRTTLKPLLPLLLSLKGKPYHLTNHFPFEPFFRTRTAVSTLLKTGRQVSKSTSLAAQGVVFSNCIPYFSTLYVTPLFEMIRRFSQNYVRPFIETTPFSPVLCDQASMKNVLQRSFRNRSQMIFSFAFLDAERTRGISADKNVIDEVQDMDKDFLPIIHETMSGSEDWGIKQYAGTPKTLENTIEVLWGDSSQAEWFIRCQHAGCRHWNIPSLEFDLVDMIGPWHSSISEQNPGVVCAKCRKPLNPRKGRWRHRFPERRWSFAGYHVPQIIMPMHYANPEKWEILLGKMAGKGNTPIHVFFNEVCGESYDSGARMVTVSDLKQAACLPWRRDFDEAKKQIGEYMYRIVAVDWGGGGGVKSGVKKHSSEKLYQSYTSIAVMGVLPSGKIDVLWGHRSLHPHEHVFEAKMIMGVMHHFKCSHVVHDYTGAGSRHETIMVQAGFPFSRLIPVAYTGPARGDIFTPKAATELHPRDHFQCDKSRSLGYTCDMIKHGQLRFFQYDHQSNDDAGLLWDFLALVEEKSDMGGGKDSFKIVRDPSMPDDFAQAVNIGAMALCHMINKWPDLTEFTGAKISNEALQATFPTKVKDWDDIG